MSERLLCCRLISLWGYLSNLKECIIPNVDIFCTRCSKGLIDSLTNYFLTDKYSQGTVLST